MIRSLFYIALAATIPLPASATVLSGEVVSQDSQAIFTPQSRVVPVPLRTFVPDGEMVHANQTIVSVDPGSALTDLEKFTDDLDAAQIDARKDIAEAKVKHAEAEIALVSAKADLDVAAIDAALPKALISALDFDRYKSELSRCDTALSAAKSYESQTSAAVSRIDSERRYDIQRIQLELDAARLKVEKSTVKAAHDGTIIHSFDQLTRGEGRYEEGGSALPGAVIGQVIGTNGTYSVHLWALKFETVGMRISQPLRLRLDAYPDQDINGKVSFIAAAATKKPEWGQASYVEIGVTLDAPNPRLLSGMNVTADTDPSDTAFDPAEHTRALAKTWTLPGEVFASRSNTISAPSIPGVWQMTVAQITSDGQAIRKGDPVVAFDRSGTEREVSAKQADLAEAMRKHDDLVADITDRAKKDVLAVASANADLEKAKLKAAAPKAYTPGVEYRKLQIGLDKAAKLLLLSKDRADLSTEQRDAEEASSTLTLRKLQERITKLKSIESSLSIRAPDSGVFLRQMGLDGKKVESGTQLFPGQTVGSIPDLSSLAVRVLIPERSLAQIHEGDQVSVTLSGSGALSVPGRVISLGRVVHSASRTNPLPVVSMDVSLSKIPATLRPGQIVSVSAGGRTT